MTSSGSLPSGRRTTRTSSSSTPDSSRGQLADQLLERRRAERARLLAGRVDVVGQGDPLRVAGEQRDLAAASAPCRGWRRRSRSPPGGPSARPCSPRRSPPGRSCGSPLRPVDEVQRPALVEQRRRRRVQVLGPAVDAVLAPPCPGSGRRGPPRGRSRRGSGRSRARGTGRRRRRRAGAGSPRPTSTSSSGGTWRLAASWRPSVSQPPGAQPSWCFSIVASVKPRPRR